MGLIIFVNLFILLLAHETTPSHKVCPEKYLRFSDEHTYCKQSNSECHILNNSVGEEDVNVILKIHNNHRSKIALGKEKNLPPASDMLQMVWDEELAAVAQAHANLCKFQHDCNECRRVPNFGVGQNLAIEQIIGSLNIPKPNWPNAIRSWYDEIDYFYKDAIRPFIAPPAEPTYGHFTQLVWADSWRIGCGYALYQEGKVYNKLYVCNYGKAGNIVQGSMYSEGEPCSSCPVNTECGKTRDVDIDYPGLCKVIDGEIPSYALEVPTIFHCDFTNLTECEYDVTGVNKWSIYHTLAGNYLGIVLRGEENSTIHFSNPITPTGSTFCFIIRYRTGPNIAGQEDSHEVYAIFDLTDVDYQIKQNLPDFPEDVKQVFNEYTIAMNWNRDFKFKISFSVPPEKPEQFLELETLYAINGLCY